MVWLAFSVMALAAVLCVAWPLLRPHRGAAGDASDVAFYRDQLRELDADVDRGVLRAADVEATRIELGRRLIQAVDATGAAVAPGRRRGAAAAVAACFVLAVAGGLYTRVGHPEEPDMPLAARASGTTDFAAAVAKIEAHLAADPNDGRGYEVIAPIYLRAGRFDDAVRAYRGVLRTLGVTPARQAELGQAVVMQADGVVTAEARGIFDAALQRDPLLPQARFFEGLAALQDGDRDKARAVWAAIVAEAPPGAPYVETVRRRIADLAGADGSMPAGAAAVAALPPGQQRAAIQGMVDGLAARLARDGADPQGWLRLVRAYRVLGEGDKAAKALADARRAVASDPRAAGELDALARELGLEG